MTKRNPSDDKSKQKTKTNKTIEDETRQSIATFLPDAIGQALKSYYRFSQQSASFEAKEFSAHHSACKVAIAHIELLIKLARWADLPDQEQSVQSNDQVIMAAMVEEAQKELSLYNEGRKDQSVCGSGDAED